MQIWKQTVLFYIGGSAYMTLEFLFRGWSHYSMFLLGGLCFVIIGQLGRRLQMLPLSLRLLLCAGIVTALELLTGLAVNRDYTVWDYRGMLWNYRGQICLQFTLLWIPVSLLAMMLYEKADRLTQV